MTNENENENQQNLNFQEPISTKPKFSKGRADFIKLAQILKYQVNSENQNFVIKNSRDIVRNFLESKAGRFYRK